MKIDCNTSLKDLFQIAKGIIDGLQEDEEFIVKDLFRGLLVLHSTIYMMF